MNVLFLFSVCLSHACKKEKALELRRPGARVSHSSRLSCVSSSLPDQITERMNLRKSVDPERCLPVYVIMILCSVISSWVFVLMLY